MKRLLQCALNAERLCTKQPHHLGHMNVDKQKKNVSDFPTAAQL
jgi:hypothetical protein